MVRQRSVARLLVGGVLAVSGVVVAFYGAWVALWSAAADVGFRPWGAESFLPFILWGVLIAAAGAAAFVFGCVLIAASRKR